MKAELFEAIINTMFRLESEINIIKLAIIRGRHTRRTIYPLPTEQLARHEKHWKALNEFIQDEKAKNVRFSPFPDCSVCKQQADDGGWLDNKNYRFWVCIDVTTI
jgi:hypothetical protein